MRPPPPSPREPSTATVRAKVELKVHFRVNVNLKCQASHVLTVGRLGNDLSGENREIEKYAGKTVIVCAKCK